MVNVHRLRLLVAAALVLVLILTLEASPAAGALRKACRVRDTKTGQTYVRLQDAVRAADPARTLIVRGTCVGRTDIGRSLVIKGVATRRSGKPILDGARKTRLLTVHWGATVVVKDLIIQHGRADTLYDHGVGGGIANFGALTLRNVVVRDNFAASDGSGIYNQHLLTLAGRTRIRDNRRASGISSYGYSWWTPIGGERGRGSITMEDASLVSGHVEQGGVYVEDGILTMNDDSSIFGNEARGGGGVSLWIAQLVMNDTSSIHDNRARGSGGGVHTGGAYGAGSVTLNDASSIHDNRAVAADGSPGLGGGLWSGHRERATLVGVVCGPGGNVHGNSPDDCYVEQ